MHFGNGNDINCYNWRDLIMIKELNFDDLDYRQTGIYEQNLKDEYSNESRQEGENLNMVQRIEITIKDYWRSYND